MESRSAIPKMRRAIWLVLADDLGAIEAKRTVTSYSYFLYMVTVLYRRLYWLSSRNLSGKQSSVKVKSPRGIKNKIRSGQRASNLKPKIIQFLIACNLGTTHANKKIYRFRLRRLIRDGRKCGNLNRIAYPLLSTFLSHLI